MSEQVNLKSVGLILGGIGALIGAIAFASWWNREPTQAELAPEAKESVRKYVDNAVAPDAPPERAPVYEEPDDLKTADIERAAMRAVYERCSSRYMFREGSTVESVYVAPMGKRKTALVNVGVKLADPSKAQGHALWFRVDLDRKGAIEKMLATKDIAAELCGLEKVDHSKR